MIWPNDMINFHYFFSISCLKCIWALPRSSLIEKSLDFGQISSSCSLRDLMEYKDVLGLQRFLPRDGKLRNTWQRRLQRNMVNGRWATQRESLKVLGQDRCGPRYSEKASWPPLDPKIVFWSDCPSLAPPYVSRSVGVSLGLGDCSCCSREVGR